MTCAACGHQKKDHGWLGCKGAGSELVHGPYDWDVTHRYKCLCAKFREPLELELERKFGPKELADT